MVDSVTVSNEDATHLVCDFLKRNRILGEFVIASYDYHKMMGNLHGISEPFGRDNAKAVIVSNIKRYTAGAYDSYGRSLRQLFISFAGSFDWSESKKGLEYWRKYLEGRWNKYLSDKYHCESISLK
jgi:hypothetical protein